MTLCERMLILLVEQGHLPKERVLDAIAGVVEVKQEIAGRTEGVVVSMTSIGLLRAVAQGLSAVTAAQPEP